MRVCVCVCVCVYQFGPVDTEEFLNAAIRGKQQVVEKYLCDDGNPNACDKVLMPHSYLPLDQFNSIQSTLFILKG